jgi:hypothetical protein
VKAYVASSYANAALVRDAVHSALTKRRIWPTSRWAMTATGPEDFSKMAPEALREVAESNDSDLFAADVCFVCDETRKGGETYAEARLALQWEKPVVWLGRPLLSMWRRGVVRVDCMGDALLVLEGMRERHERGYTGFALVAA